MRILATILLLLLSSTAWSIELKNIKASVLLQDAASGGCWTNLKETREYAEEKLRMKNIQIEDKVYIPNMGAYSTSCSTDFNGFPAPIMAFVD